MDPGSHLHRRSRLRSFAAGAGHLLHLDGRSPNDSSELEERYNPDITYNTNISDEAVSTTSAAKTSTTAAAASTSKSTSTAASTSKSASSAAAVSTSTSRAAAKAATAGTTRTSVTTAVTTSKAANYVTSSSVAVSSSAAKSTISSSSAVTSKAVTSSSASKSVATSSTPTSTVHSSTTTSTSIAKTSTSTTSHTVSTVTSNVAVVSVTSSSTSSSAKTSATAAASTSSTTTGMSTGSVVGVVFAVVAGIVALAALGGWLYRKYASRSYSTKSPWSKLDDDITPFPSSFEKDGGGDIYGSTNSAPVIGSRRALALARTNAFNTDGSLRPDSEMYERDNRAGFGAGGMSFGPYPTLQQPVGAYGLDPHGRPYNPHAGRTPMDHTLDAQYDEQYDDDPYQYSVANTRQLVGRQPMPTAMPMGRPSAPATDAELAQAEDFADIPEPYTPGLMYGDGALITPINEINNPVWPDEKAQGRSRVSMTTPTMSSGPLINIEPVVTPPSFMPTPLPALAPLSPLSSSFNLNRRSQPLAMYEDEQSQQKRMYGEVAQTAGIEEPTTPNTAMNPSASSSFAAAPIHQSLPTLTAMPRLPEISLAPPQPYQHGQPLSPLNEVPTPLSNTSGTPNPFEQISMPVPPYRQEAHALAPPYSASSSGFSFPSPQYPPPSPGGMSVPGSVTDSPRRWSGAPRGRVVSQYDEEDAYGGI